MSVPLLVEFYNALPDDALRGGLDWPTTPSITNREEGRSTESKRVGGKARRRAAIHVFRKQVQQRYTEGTLRRVLLTGDVAGRRAAAFALGLLGAPAINDDLAAALLDPDEEVARLACEALWTVWFRGDNSAHSNELYRILRLRDRAAALAALDDLIRQAPQFAEAYNQRAILYFRLEKFDRAVSDCESTLRLNPFHFGAQAGLGQSLLRLRKPRAALRAFRVALRINPRLDDIADTVRSLENALGEEGRF
ncbi:MAG: tetratricopeptide repeat protein [Gemmataceae bacterium]